MESFDILVIGGGAAGMAAALELSRGGARVLLAERSEALGGVLPQCIHHGFGLGYFSRDLTGPEYAAEFIKKIENSDVEVRLGTMVLELREDKTALLSSPKGAYDVAFGRCILCTGSRERSIGSLKVGGTRPAGVFTAGTAQKMVNLGGYDIGRRIVILGSGDIGQIMARRLTLLGREIVAMVEQNSRLGGLVRNQKNCIEAYNIPVILNATVERIHGAGRVSGVTVRHLDSGETEILPCDTLITAIGLIPERELMAGIGQPEWLQLCGNCDYIHEIVDTVSAQAERLAAEIMQKGDGNGLGT